MIHEPEFVRGNQKNYIRIACDEEWLAGYEYQMCRHNALKSILDFQQRSQNGENYLYYEVSGMQSLDVFLQIQKLKREFAEVFLRSIDRLCKEISEFALNIRCVVFLPEFVMVNADGKEVRFLYSFSAEETENATLENLLECCIEYLDYKDEEITQQLYKIYENLLEQKERFSLSKEVENFLSTVFEKEPEDIIIQAVDVTQKVDVLHEMNSEAPVVVSERSKTAVNEFKKMKNGTMILLIINIAVLFLWQPLTILKIFFSIAMGSVLIVLNIHINKKEKTYCKVKEQQQKAQENQEEYELFCKRHGIDDDVGTQIITVKDSEKFLYGMQDKEPQVIYFSDIKKIVGKDSNKAQVCIAQEGVSRIHAAIWRESDEYKIEDLNSTNGTWINGKELIPRKPQGLNNGDRVRFAEVEYIFR